MTDSELIVLFGLAMLALAIVAIAIDWVGKPIHRRFLPKIYRYPEELQSPPDPSRTEWSDDTFEVPDNPPDDQPMAYADGSTEWSNAELVVPEPFEGAAPGPTLFADVPDEVLHPDAESSHDEQLADIDIATASTTAAAPDSSPRGSGWRPGQFIFNLTRDGDEPSAEVVRRRFWRNIGSSEHSRNFGASNAERLAAGRPPTRRNPRTGSIETLALPLKGSGVSGGRTPKPRWPDDDIDPYGGA